jgi:hypothetical protein
MGGERIAKTIYKSSRRRLEQEEEALLPLTKTWCKYTRDLLTELHLVEIWRTEAVGTEEDWNKLVRERIHEREEIKWRTQCLLRPKLRTYCKIKKDLRFEPYLQIHHRGGIPELAKIRGGSNRLRIEQGRYEKEQASQRVCRLCANGSVEDESHFMLQCPVYDDLRNTMWTKFEQATGWSKSSFKQRRTLNALIGYRFQPPATTKGKTAGTVERIYRNVVQCVMTFVTTAMKRRRILLDNDRGHVRFGRSWLSWSYL